MLNSDTLMHKQTARSKSQTPKLHHHQTIEEKSYEIINWWKNITMISWQHSSMKILQHDQGDMRSSKYAKGNPPSWSKASFRSKTTDLDISDVQNLMKAMISEHFILFCNYFQIFIGHSPKMKISIWKSSSGTETIVAQSYEKSWAKSY